MGTKSRVKATIRKVYDSENPDGKEWHSVRGTELSGGSYSYLGEYGTDSYEFVKAVSFTKNENTVICDTDEATYVVQKREDGRWFSIARLVAYGYLQMD